MFRTLLIFSENISCPLPSILVSYLRLLVAVFREVLTVIFKFQITEEGNIHNNIQKVIFK